MKFKKIIFLLCFSFQWSILPMHRLISALTRRPYTTLSITAATSAGIFLYNWQNTAHAMPEGETLLIALEIFFRYENNPHCKDISTKCDYSINEALQIFYTGAFPHSVIPDLSFENNTNLIQWAKSQKSSKTYLIAYKPGCPPCASLLVVIESMMKKSSKQNNVFKINTRNNRNAFVDLNGTPTIFVVENGKMTEIDRLQFLKIASKLAE